MRLTVLDTEERPVRKVRREFGTREWIPGYLDFWPFLRVSKIPVGESRQVSVDLPPGHGTVSAEFGYRDWFAIEDRDLIFQRLTRRF